MKRIRYGTPILRSRNIALVKKYCKLLRRVVQIEWILPLGATSAYEVFSEMNKFAIKDCRHDYGSWVHNRCLAAASLYNAEGANFYCKTPSLREGYCYCLQPKKSTLVPAVVHWPKLTGQKKLGCEHCKIFPGSTYGPSLLRPFRTQLGQYNATGGVTRSSNLKGWFDAALPV